MGTESAITQRAFLTGARLKISRLQLDGDLDKLYRSVGEISAQALKVERVSVWFFDSSFQRLSCKVLVDLKGESAPPPLLMTKAPAYLTAIRERRYVAVNDARTEASTRELLDYLETWNVSSMLDAAIYRNGVVVGIVCHEHTGPMRIWKREECQFAATVADLLAHFVEVSERMNAEALAHALELKLKDAQRIDALGRMAAGIAHDLNNMLGVITGGLQVLKQDGGLDMIEPMEEAAGHAAALVAQLLSLGRKRTPVAFVQPLDPLLAELERLLKPQVKPGSRVVFDVQKGQQVWADSSQLNQVLINLVSNALQAMPKGGVVVLRARERDGGVQFQVIDTGEGIAAENLEKLFDPFFTTRDSGNGIGLTVVQQLVTQHGGEVSVTSTPGDGTTFELWWPSAIPG